MACGSCWLARAHSTLEDKTNSPSPSPALRSVGTHPPSLRLLCVMIKLDCWVVVSPKKSKIRVNVARTKVCLSIAGQQQALSSRYRHRILQRVFACGTLRDSNKTKAVTLVVRAKARMLARTSGLSNLHVLLHCCTNHPSRILTFLSDLGRV
jgi:hypothetical protein